MRAAAIGIAVAMAAGSAVEAADPLRLLAAGSLRAALTEVADAWTWEHDSAASADFGPAGLWRDRVRGGEAQRFTAEMSGANGSGRIFVNSPRNERGVTAFAPCSLRP